ncbi:MAG: pyrroline-5-carboxylate reductase [Deltaproteobacteria bacterium]|nr:pyrroline-5-carboxylate reductase [Deltaproteobacteria bacterium]
MRKKQKLGFIGAGNMATALIKGLIESKTYAPENLLAADCSEAAIKKISGDFGVECTPFNSDIVTESDVVVLSVKPQVIREVIENIKGGLRDNHLVISIAAGIPLKMIQDIIKKDIPLIRVMPNTPALVLHGVSALAAGPSATSAHMETAKEIFGAVGDTVEVTEEMMDAVTAVSGSGPGYVFYMMECMVDAAVAVGLEREVATRLVTQTFLGAGHLAKTSTYTLSELREKVTSPGGTTQAGLEVMNRKGLKAVIEQAVDAACRRSVELGKTK